MANEDPRIEMVARALWAAEFSKPMEEVRDEAPSEEDAKPGWWVEDVWDAMLDTARIALAALNASRPSPGGDEVEAAAEAYARHDELRSGRDLGEASDIGPDSLRAAIAEEKTTSLAREVLAALDANAEAEPFEYTCGDECAGGHCPTDGDHSAIPEPSPAGERTEDER